MGRPVVADRADALSAVEIFGRQAPAVDRYPAAETGDAEFFADVVEGSHVYDWQRQRWYVFGPHHWRPDLTGQTTQAAIDAMRQRQALAVQGAESDERQKRIKWTLAGESEARIRHLLKLASSHPRLAVDGSAWDADAWTLGAENGVVDLRTGQCRAGRPADYITRAAAVPYAPDATCPRWDRFVLDVCADDPDLATFLHRSTGYALSGATSEQCFWIFHGLGANGKTTFLETLTRHVVPEHAWTMAFPVSSWAESMSEYQRVNRREILTPGRRPILTPYLRCLKRQDSLPVSMISQ